MALHPEMFLDGHGREDIRLDPEFSGWSGAVPRLWFIDQQRALQIGSTQIYGDSLLATAFSRTLIESALPSINDIGVLATRGYKRANTDNLAATADTGVVHSQFFRAVTDTLPTITDTGHPIFPGSSIVTQLVRRPT